MITRGTLRFEPPDRLEKHITAPREETHVITAERVIIDRGQRQRDFSLDRAPALAALRQALLGWLTADAASLEKHFEVELDDRDGAWTLILRPRSGDLADELDRLVLSGDNDTAHRLETHLADGEVITTRFEPDA